MGQNKKVKMVDKSTKSPNFYDLPRISDLCARCKGFVVHDLSNKSNQMSDCPSSIIRPKIDDKDTQELRLSVDKGVIARDKDDSFEIQRPSNQLEPIIQSLLIDAKDCKN